MKKIKVTFCLNYFDRSKRVDRELDYTPGLSVFQIISQFFNAKLPCIPSVNGKVIRDKDYELSPGDHLVLIPAIYNADRLLNPFSSGHDPIEAIKKTISSFTSGASLLDIGMDSARIAINAIPGVGGIAEWTEDAARRNPWMVEVGALAAGLWTYGAGAMLVKYAAARYGITQAAQAPNVPTPTTPHIATPGFGGGGGGGGGGIGSGNYGGGGSTPGFETSNSYSWSPQTAQQLGACLPRIYGEIKVQGNIIAGHVNTVVAGSHPGDQVLNVLIALGQGPMKAFNQIEINNRPYTAYENVQLETRFGGINQSAVGLFNDTYTPDRALNLKLETGVWIGAVTNENEFNGLELIFTCPSGLYQINTVSTELHYEDVTVPVYDNTGERIGRFTSQKYLGMTHSGGDTVMGEVAFNIRYKLTTSSTWIAYPPGLNCFITDLKTSSFTKTFRIDNIPAGQYEVQVNRVTESHHGGQYVDDVYFTAINTIIYDDFSYPRVGLVSIKALASSQLSGSFNFSSVVQGSYVRVWNGVSWTVEYSTDPAWVAYDILTMPVFDDDGTALKYDGTYIAQPNVLRFDGEDPSRVDLASFKAWSDYCNETSFTDSNGDIKIIKGPDGAAEKRFTFNGIFDANRSQWDCLMEVCKMCRSMIVIKGYKYYVVIDRPTVPVQMFTAGNIIMDSFEETFLSINDRATEFEVEYLNAQNDYKREVVTIISPTASITKQSSNEQYVGTTSITQAWRTAEFRLNCNNVICRFIKFGAEIDAITCTIGDLIYFAHELPQWGYSGRLVNAKAIWVELDRDIALTHNVVYAIRVRLNDNTIVSRSHIAVAGSFTGSITNTTLSITAVTSGTLLVGCTIAGTGVASGTRIERVITGSGGVGTYKVSVNQSVSSTPITISTWNRITVSAINIPFITVESSVQITFAQSVPTSNLQMAIGDYDGDGIDDLVVIHTDGASFNWYLKRSTAGETAAYYGDSSDIPVQGDYSGDGKFDIAVWRPSTGAYYYIDSADWGSKSAGTWGSGTTPFFDIPVPGDYGSDFKFDKAVWRLSDNTWYLDSGGSKSYGIRSTDIATQADYFGTGKVQLSCWRLSELRWFIDGLPTGYIDWPNFIAGDLIVIGGDFDGDGKADMAFFRPSNKTLYVKTSSSIYTTEIALVLSDYVAGDMITVGDFNGDGNSEPAHYRPSTKTLYYYPLSSCVYDIYSFGEVFFETKPFRVTKIDPNIDLTFTIEAVEYNATVYDSDVGEPAVPTPDYSSLEKLPPVTNLTLNEIVIKLQDSSLSDNIDVQFIKPLNFSMVAAEIWYKAPSTAGYVFAGKTYSDQFRISNLPMSGGSELYTVVVSTVNSFGQKLDLNISPSNSIQMVGMSDPPSSVTNFYASQVGDSIRMDWKHIEDGDRAGYEIRMGNAWDTGLVIGSRITDDYFYYRPELSGTYQFFIKAIDTTYHYSTSPTSVIVTTYNITSSLNIVYDHDYVLTPASGTMYNFTYGSGNGLCGGNSLQFVQSAGSGSYETNEIDLLKSGNKTVRFIDNIDSSEDATDLTFPNRTDLTYPDDTDLHISGDYYKYPVFMATATTGATKWWGVEWTPYYGPVEVNARYFKFREDFRIASSTAKMSICSFRTIVDVPETSYKLTALTILSGGTTISFATYGLIFWAIPVISATPVNSSIPLVPYIYNKSATGFTIKLLDIVGDAFSGSADITIFGY